jgi:hypothetical protein
MDDWSQFCASDRAANVVRMDLGRRRSTPQSDDESTSVQGDKIRKSEIPA